MVKIWSPDIDIVEQTLTLLDSKISQLPAESVEFINADSGTTIASGGSETVNIKAPAGYLYDLIAIRLYIPAPSGGTSGDHRFSVASESENMGILMGKSDYATVVHFNRGEWIDANAVEYPSTKQGQVLMIKNLRVDEANGIDILYRNDTDVDQTASRWIRLWVRKIKVA